MITGVAPHTRDRQAIVLSFAVHACAAIVVLLGFSRIEPSDSQLTEVVSPTEFISIVRPMPRPHPTTHAVTHVHSVALAVRPIAQSPKRTRKAAAPSTLRPAAPELHVERRNAPQMAPLVSATSPGESTVAATVATTNADAGAPIPVESAAPVAAPTPRHEHAGVGAFGEEYTPSFNPPNLGAQIKGWFTSHFHVRVSVDENGHAIDLTWLVDVADVELHDRVAKTLLAAKYVPASCNGLPCAKMLDLQN